MVRADTNHGLRSIETWTIFSATNRKAFRASVAKKMARGDTNHGLEYDLALKNNNRLFYH